MTFKDFMMKVRRIILCCPKEERKHSLEIGSPTDVRHMDIGEGMPGLTEEERKMIREKASSDAIRLLSLQSHPPTQPPSPTSHTYPYPQPTSGLSSREPSVPLLNAASADLPSTVPTPPRHQHTDTSPPASRMKSMWEHTRRLSNSISSHHSGYHELSRSYKKDDGEDDGVVLLNLNMDFKNEEINLDSPVSMSVSGKSMEGFETADVIGGAGGGAEKLGDTPCKKSLTEEPAVLKAIRDTDAGDSSASDSEVDAVAGGERKPLVRA